MPNFEKIRASLFAFPARVISVSFALVIAAGTFLLMLPISARSGEITNFFDALFTATSATCVTGLVVVDTYSHWTLFGQIVILMLIQIGGLGLVTFTTFFNLLIGKKLGLRGMHLAQESLNSTSFIDITRIVKVVVMVSLLIECVGALLLCGTFVPKYGLPGIFISIFLAVSGFCNAGFDILGREGAYISLCNYNGDLLVLITISMLIILGGLGFAVWYDLLNYRKNRRLMLHSALVLIVSGILILAGMAVFLILEWNNPDTLGGLPIWERFGAAFFQSVTLRTAGFNSVPIESLGGATKVLSMVLMFIGAAPGSTGGGIKVTTFAVVVMTVISVLRGREDTIIRRRKVAKQAVYKAIAVMLSALVAVCICAGIIYSTHPVSDGINGLDSFFEAVSAFATVGLSAGVSGVANLPSRLALCLTMFLGRVGPVSLALSLAMRAPSDRNTVIPEAKIIVG